MALPDELAAVRDRALADLAAAHDYYEDTKLAWGIVHQHITAGNQISSRNVMTGTVTTDADLLGKARGYVAGHLAEATFQHFIAIFEGFFFDLLRLWLAADPRSLLGKQVDFKVVFEAPDKDSIVDSVVRREVSDVLYDRPANWFAYLENKAKLGCPSASERERLAEAKASRDVLVHNRGVVSRTYLSKAGKLARYKEGERIEIPEPYHRDIWELIRKIVTDLSNTAIAKGASPAS